MSVIGNLLWLLLGGLVLSIGWCLAGLLLCITVIGIPLGIQCFKIAALCLAPFGRTIEYGGGLGSLFLNFLWIILFGWELAIVSLVSGLLLCATIIGIPFGMQAFKLAKLSLMPFGSAVV